MRRRGNRAALAELEQREPDLAEFLLEEATGLHRDVLATGATAKRARALSRRVETLALVLVIALRHAHARLWSVEEPSPPTTSDRRDRADDDSHSDEPFDPDPPPGPSVPGKEEPDE